MASYLRLYANEMLIHSCHRRRWMRIRTCLYFYYSSLLSFVSFPPSGCHKKQISMINYISHCAPVENELVALYRWSMRGGECRQRALALALFLGAAHGPDRLSEETESAGGVKLGWISGLFIDRCVSNSTSSNLKRRKLGLSEQHLKPKRDGSKMSKRHSSVTFEKLQPVRHSQLFCGRLETCAGYTLPHPTTAGKGSPPPLSIWFCCISSFTFKSLYEKLGHKVLAIAKCAINMGKS